MRKTLLIASVLCFNIVAAQQPASKVHPVPVNPKVKLKTLPKPLPSGNEIRLPVVSPVPSAQSGSSSGNLKTSGLREEEAIIGFTQWDYQTNRGISNRFLRNADGTMSATWTTLCPNDGASERGTGYNYFNGTTWDTLDCLRIEPTERSGYPSIGVTATGKELVIAHSSTAFGMLMTYRPVKGTGAWIEDPTILGSNQNDTWARMVVGGPDGNTVHALWNTTTFDPEVEYCGQIGAIAYSRSLDGGATWPILHQCIAEIDTPFYIGFDPEVYAIDAMGSNVAILIGDWITDLVLLKSTDNGDTWTKQILYEFPIPLYDEEAGIIDTNNDAIPDTLLVPNGDGRVAFDNNGKIHVVFSKVWVLDYVDADPARYYPTVDGGIWYWNESMGINPPVDIAYAEDLNGDSLLNFPVINPSNYAAGTYNGGLSLQPTIGFDASNNTFVTYATYDELADTLLGAGHRHVYVIGSYNNGLTWTVPYDVVPTGAEGGDGEFQEAVFACMAKVVDDQIHIIYQRDAGPGTSTSNIVVEQNWNTDPNNIVYAGVAKGELTSAGSISASSFSVSQNIPNPAADQTIISVTLPASIDVRVDVYDLLGQKVFALPSSNYSAGVHSFKIDCSKLAPGVYFYEVSAGNERVTKKMIIE